MSRGGKNTKIHALADGSGNPVRLIFTSGEVHDSKEGLSLLEDFDITGSAVLGDKAYGTVEILAYVRKHGGEVVIPLKATPKNRGIAIIPAIKNGIRSNASSIN